MLPDTAFEAELLGQITQELPFQYVDSIQEISEAAIRGAVLYNLAVPRCRTTRLEAWLCVEMLAQLAEIHTRWLTKAKRANGLLVGVDGLSFEGCPEVVSGELTLTVERLELVATFLKYAGKVEYEGRCLASGTITIYNVGSES